MVLFTYLRLKLHLRIAGFAPVFHDYDWRLGIDELGRGLAERLRGERSRTMIVAHSMGGLVSRAAMSHSGLEHVERVVLLGTPNTRVVCAGAGVARGVRGRAQDRAAFAEVRPRSRWRRKCSALSRASITCCRRRRAMPGRISSMRTSWPANGPQPNAPLLSRAREVLGDAGER